MMELNYETPASTAVAIVLALLILTRAEEMKWNLHPVFSSGTASRSIQVCFLLLCAAAAGTSLTFLPHVIRAEYHYDLLHNMTDPRFSTDLQEGRFDPAAVRKALKQCDPRSPFPYASASSGFLMLGPYYTAEALDLLDQAIARTPKRAAFYYRKYRILQLLGRKADAESALQNARTLSPKNPQYYPNGITPYGSRSY